MIFLALDVFRERKKRRGHTCENMSVCVCSPCFVCSMCVLMCKPRSHLCVCVSAGCVFLSVHLSITLPHSSPANSVNLVPVGVASLKYSIVRYLPWPRVSAITFVKYSFFKMSFSCCSTSWIKPEEIRNVDVCAPELSRALERVCGRIRESSGTTICQMKKKIKGTDKIRAWKQCD